MFRLTLDAIEYVAALIRDERIDCDFVRCGAVTLAAKPGHVAALEASARFLHERLGYETELLGTDGDRQGDRQPALPWRAGGSGSLCPAPGQVCSRTGQLPRPGPALACRRTSRSSGSAECREDSRSSLGDAVIRTREVLAATNGYTPRALSSPSPPSHSDRQLPDRHRAARRLSWPSGWFRGAGSSATPNTCSTTSGFPPIAEWCLAAAPRSRRPVSPGSRQSCGPECGRSFLNSSTVDIEFAWSGKVAYPLDHLPHAGRLDGVHYSMGYCGHGVALATYLGAPNG